MNLGDRKDITIGSNVFHIAKFEPIKAMINLGGIQKIISPVIGNALGGAKGINGVLDKDIANANDLKDLLPMLKGLFFGLGENLDGDKINKLLKILLDAEYISVDDPISGNTVKLNQSMINTVFMGDYGDLPDMMILAYEVVKVNYASFFTRLSTQFGSLGALVAKK